MKAILASKNLQKLVIPRYFVQTQRRLFSGGHDHHEVQVLQSISMTAIIIVY